MMIMYNLFITFFKKISAGVHTDLQEENAMMQKIHQWGRQCLFVCFLFVCFLQASLREAIGPEKQLDP